ncbi:MAG: AAA family ATPase [Gammaproteobacteria bacterium]|nr:AAA family ATPase [Gammaproteobacteria bacterium]
MSGVARWLSERPQWLQIAAPRLLQRSELTDNDVSELVTLCQQEAEGKLAKKPSPFPADAFSQSTAGTLRLCSISKVEGVNALAPQKPLKFGKNNITMVYGNNGSGKSGYVRLLKHVCGKREPGTLHRDVYKSDAATQKACISYEQNGVSKTHTWLAGSGVCDDLNSVDIFDTSFGRVFVSKEDAVSYEPPVLLFFSALISACDKVKWALDAEAKRYPSKKPNIPADQKATPEGVWYEAISHKTSSQDMDQHCARVDEAEMQGLQRRLAEPAPADKAKQLRNQKQHVDTLVQDAQKHLDQLSDEKVRQIISAKKMANLKKTAADTAAQKAFSDGELEGVGSDVWKALWEAARNYSVSTAYKETEYPNVFEASRCVLCHQTLTQEAKDRLVSFEKFVKDETQKIASDAAKKYTIAIGAIDGLPNSDMLKTRIDAAGLKDEFTSQVTSFFAQLQARKDRLLGIDFEKAIADPLPSQKWMDEAKAQSNSLDTDAKKYDEDAKRDHRKEIQNQLNSLQAKKWLFENCMAIKEEVVRLKRLNLIQEAQKLANTKALSQKKGELAEALITDAFVERFNAELKALGASQVKVELVKLEPVSKGRVLHKIQLRGASEHKITDVLSEGESRIVSIAAFLADVTGKSKNAPFIFDDPISSLDQNYEEAVVERLVELSRDKQVIVFTHRLSLLGTIQDSAKKKEIDLDVLSIRSADWGTGEPASIPIAQKDIKSALNTLINQCQDAKKDCKNGEFESVDFRRKSMCSDFRIVVERAIENDLLCGVVQRFQRPIHTLKLRELAKLTPTDCDFLDSLMTKYSKFAHSQPSEQPVDLPKLDEILEDMKLLKEWREEYQKKTVTSSAGAAATPLGDRL